MSRKGCSKQDPPLTTARIQEARLRLRWSRTLESHRLGYEQWLQHERKVRQ